MTDYMTSKRGETPRHLKANTKMNTNDDPLKFPWRTITCPHCGATKDTDRLESNLLLENLRTTSLGTED